MPDLDRFRRELTTLINACALENASNTPDYMLADYLIECLHGYNALIKARDAWYGHPSSVAAPAAVGAVGSFTIKRGTYALHVYKNSDDNFTLDLDPQELGEDPHP